MDCFADDRPGRQVRDWLVSLTAITLLDIFSGVVTHGRPEVAYVQSFLGERSAPRVVATLVVVNFAEDLKCLWVLYAGEMRAGV